VSIGIGFVIQNLGTFEEGLHRSLDKSGVGMEKLSSMRGCGKRQEGEWTGLG
jgi:hypothetical protein